MNGKIVAGSILVTALLAGAGVYYLQEYAFYSEVAFAPGHEILLTDLAGQPEPIPVRDVKGIDGTASPLKFRACFTSDVSIATLTEGYQVYDAPTPLIAPAWFSCFDAEAIGAALESGEAVAFLGQADIAPTPSKPGATPVIVDRVVAVFPDGRAFAWNQLSPGTEP